MLRFIWFCYFLIPVGVMIAVGVPVSLAKTHTDCSAKLDKGEFVPAATCYRELVKAMPHGKQLSLLDKKRKSLYLSKESYGLSQAARLSSDVAQRAYLYEQAKTPLEQILEEQLCLKEFRCRLLKGQVAELAQNIGYVRLVLVIQRKASVRVKLTGYQFSREWVVAETVTLQLRPGTYQLSFQEQANPPQNQSITMTPSSNTAVTLAAQIVIQKVVAPVSRVGSLTLVGIGAGLAVVAGILVGVGYANQKNADNLAAQQNTQRSDKELIAQWQKGATIQDLDKKTAEWSKAGQTIDNNKTSGNLMVGIGWPIAGLGLGALIAGAVWIASLPKNAPPPPKQTVLPPTNSPTSAHISNKPHRSHTVWKISLDFLSNDG